MCGLDVGNYCAAEVQVFRCWINICVLQDVMRVSIHRKKTDAFSQNRDNIIQSKRFKYILRPVRF